MSNTTELSTLATSARDGFPPPPPAPPAAPVVTPPNQINQAPMLPYVAPPVPRPATAPTANPFASSMNQQWAPAPSPVGRSGSGKVRRFFSWLIVLGIIGGLAYVGVTYGSDLMELATGDDGTDEPAAPATFPTAAIAPSPIRTATFTVERPDALRGPQKYEVTSDFENGISRVVIDRGDAPDVEVLTLFDQAVIRRVDQPNWYRLDRGEFPIGSESGRIRWIRTIDELIPPLLRGATTITEATESAVGTESARRLVLSIDPAAITQASATAPVLPPGITLEPGPDGVEQLTVEVWVDGSGIVRKSVMPVELGGETITVTSMSPDAWQPVFPTEDMIAPMTASALFNLGF
jgi:hypothetical protein